MTKNTFKINIKQEKQFLKLIKKKLNGNQCIHIIENDLKMIIKSKTLTLDNIQELFTYLNDAEYNNTHYFNGLKDLLLNTEMTAIEAISFIEEVKLENDYMMSIMCKYFADLDNGEVA